jgi:hypothetical protein
MKKRLISLLAALPLLAAAQEEDPQRFQLANRLVPHMGFMWEFATSDQGGSTLVFEDFYNFHIGSYVVLAHKNDVVSVGLDPSAQLGFNLVQSLDLLGNVRTRASYTFQAPVFLMARVGAAATPYNQQSIGLGVGAGVVYTYFNQFIPNTQNRRFASYFTPSVVGDVTILSAGNPLTLRVHLGIERLNGRLVTENVDNGSQIVNNLPLGNFGLGLIYGF